MLLVYLIGALLCLGAQAQDEARFPDDFLLGFATASYQIEGAWNEDGKGENIWDRLTHSRPDLITNGANGDIADDSYHKYKEDVQLLKELGAQVYRFSLSWSRILPNGDIATINQPGIDYYNNLIDELLNNGITPMITIYHWDLPQPLQDLGGWSNPLIADHYEDFARLVFKTYGDRVKWWITFNEPLQTCHAGYGGMDDAPVLNSHGIAEYLCTHTLLKAHARAYHVYDEEFRSTQNGQVGITLNGGFHTPASDSAEDIEAAERKMLFEVGWFSYPVLKGDYPAVMRERIDANSQKEGRPRSRLPVFTDEEKKYINNTADFMGVNHYSTYYARIPPYDVGPDPSLERDCGTEGWQDEAWPPSASSWLKVVPWGIRGQVNWYKNHFNNIPVFITENGFSDGGEVDDVNRINYYNSYLHEVLNAIYEDGCNILGYTAWSLMDNFEWMKGYSERFGIYKVDYDDPNRARTPKSSVEFFKQVLSTRTLPPLDSTRRSDEYKVFLKDQFMYKKH